MVVHGVVHKYTYHTKAMELLALSAVKGDNSALCVLLISVTEFYHKDFT